MNTKIIYFLSVTRIIVGIMSWIIPEISLTLFGFQKLMPMGDSGLITRLFGVRDFILGSSLLYLAQKNKINSETGQFVIMQGIIVDSIDVFAALIAFIQGYSLHGLILSGGGALLFAICGKYLRNSDLKKDQ